jgi:GNAT superfamily N-acetyltransferase
MIADEAGRTSFRTSSGTSFRTLLYDPTVPPSIRPMSAADVDAASDMILRGGWGDRRLFFAFSVGHPSCGPIVAEVDGEIVATGVGTVNGSVGWIGAIFVDEAWRRRGLGRAVTDAVIDELGAAGCRTLVLVATDAGRRLYEPMGFEVATWYRTFEAAGASGTANAEDEALRNGATLRAFQVDDLPAMEALDRAATGEDRAHLLDAFATHESARCLVGPGECGLRGSVVRAPWGGGATTAADLEAGVAICEARRTSAPTARRVRADLLLENEAGADALQRVGWTEAWRAPRMHRGEPLVWRPSSIWGQFNHALG